jgi:thiol-disulfide isomerase/thioredoxin
VAQRRDETGPKDRTSNKYAAKKAASERLAAERAAQARAARKRNVLVAGSSTIAIVVVVVIIVIVGVTSKKSASSGANAVAPASSSVTEALSSAATSTLASTAALNLNDLVTGPPSKLSGAALKGSDGKPEIFYVGAEYCPYCAATRWPLAVALSRFGTFTGLQTTYSSDSDVDPHTPTLSFYKSSYTSQYVDFVSKEYEDGAEKPLETLTDDQNSLWMNTSGGSVPFIDFAGTWMQKGTSYDPATLKGMTPEQVAASISDSSSKSGKAIQAGADVFTAIICESTGGQPSNVCTAAGVKNAETALNAGS